MLISRAILGSLVAIALTACSAGTSMLRQATPLTPAAGASATRVSTNDVALPGAGALALPGAGALALPGAGALALPGAGALALPGGGALALPGLASVSNVLAALVNALPLCAVTSIVQGAAQCTALLNTAVPINHDPSIAAALLPGLHPSDLQVAYRFPGGGAGQTVAIVDAGNDPTAESDLAVYRSTFGLPPCTSVSGCFRKVNQSGAEGNDPATLAGWPQEIGIDIEMVSAVCPSCNILLVEANSADLSDLAASVDTAVALGASAISNSYYAPEYDGELIDETHFNHPGTAITVSSGDTGYGTTFPASSRYVTAVGGTTLVRGGARGWNETAWAGTGSGCSYYVPKPVWQHDTGCAHRTVADVAVIGDPQTGVVVYNTTASAAQAGWGVYGGTSVGAPIVAALYVLGGNARSAQGAARAYANASSFFGIVFGKNGTCSPTYLCTAGAGYNGPGGLGVPNGVSGL
jgi:subtilase family serine protease